MKQKIYIPKNIRKGSLNDLTTDDLFKIEDTTIKNSGISKITIDDWVEDKEYVLNEVVYYNGKSWRNKIEGNVGVTPIECSSDLEVRPIATKLYNIQRNTPIEQPIPPGSYVLVYNPSSQQHYASMFVKHYHITTSVIPTSTEGIDYNFHMYYTNGERRVVIIYNDLIDIDLVNNYFDCGDYLMHYEYIELHIGSSDLPNKLIRLRNCPIPTVDEVKGFINGTCDYWEPIFDVSDVEIPSNLMVNDGTNIISEDFSINDQYDGSYQLSEGYGYYNNNTNDGFSFGPYGIYSYNSYGNVDFNISQNQGLTYRSFTHNFIWGIQPDLDAFTFRPYSNQLLTLPIVTSNISTTTKTYIPISVNGVKSNKNGEITIPIDGSEFVSITEDGKTGWGLKYRADNPDYYGSIGDRAIDLTYSNSLGEYGIKGTDSFGIGLGNSLLGTNSFVLGTNNTIERGIRTFSIGNNNIINSQQSTYVIGEGNITENSTIKTFLIGFNNKNSSSLSQNSFAIGNSNILNGHNTIIIGIGNQTNATNEVILGNFSTIQTSNNTDFDRVFNVGNGTRESYRSDAFTILKNGLATLPSVTNTLIDDEPTGKAVVTKEYLDQEVRFERTAISSTINSTWTAIDTDGNGLWFALAGGSSGGAGRFYKSIDNGETWSAVSIPTVLSFIDIKTDGSGVWVAVSSSAQYYRSIDNGETWELITGPTNMSFHQITTNKNGVWIGTHNIANSTKRLYKSVDNCETFSVVEPPLITDWRSISTDEKGLWICSSTNATNQNKLLKSYDDGETWVVEEMSDYISGTFITNDRNGTWLISSQLDNKFMRSLDNGNTWELIIPPDGFHSRAISTNENGVWCSMGSSLNDTVNRFAYSFDNGDSWVVEETDTEGFLWFTMVYDGSSRFMCLSNTSSSFAKRMVYIDYYENTYKNKFDRVVLDGEFINIENRTLNYDSQLRRGVDGETILAPKQSIIKINSDVSRKAIITREWIEELFGLNTPDSETSLSLVLNPDGTISKVNKQDKLISGTTIKTINGYSIMGSGDLTADILETSPQLIDGGNATTTHIISDIISGGYA